MSKDIRIRKGLDIKLVGEADHVLVEAKPSSTYALVPDNYHGIVPRLIAREGDEVKVGQPIFHSKVDERVVFVSPVSGQLKEIRRGEKRKILEIIISSDGQFTPHPHGVLDVNKASREELVEKLLQMGCWPFIKQRPYDVIASPDDTPKAIFVSAYDSAPIAPDVDFVVHGKEDYLQTAVDALQKLTDGQVHVTISAKSSASPFRNLDGVVLHNASGPHPVGNVSTQIAAVDPISKGEKVWVVRPQDLLVIGEALKTGLVNSERVVAVNGSQVANPRYVKARIGQQLDTLLAEVSVEGDNNRVIQGNPLSGVKSDASEYLGGYVGQVAVLEEGDDYDFFGWNRPRPNKFSVLRAAMFSFLTPNKKYKLNTNTNGEERAFVLTGIYEEVFPLDIYPMHLLKSILYNDLDEMEQLGIYEVAPEDFALTEFVCVSKINHQEIVRKGLDVMIKEVG